MSSLPIGLQLYSVRGELQRDFLGTLKKVKEMGYDGVEAFGVLDKSVKEWNEALTAFDLKIPSSHVSVKELSVDTPKTMALYRELGCDYVVIPWMSFGKKSELLEENLKTIASLAEEAKKVGLQLLYHNHNFEFEKVDGSYILDIIYSTVPETLLQTQIDTCWAKFAGVEPCTYLKKYANRAPLVHLKDYYKSEHDDSVPYDLIGAEKEEKKKSDFQFRPLGTGVQDVPALLEASKQVGAKWVIVEQDESYDRSTLEDAKISIDYLRGLEW